MLIGIVLPGCDLIKDLAEVYYNYACKNLTIKIAGRKYEKVFNSIVGHVTKR